MSATNCEMAGNNCHKSQLVHNHNPNPNKNIHMIYAEPRVVIMRGGAATGVDHNTQQGQPQVRPVTQKKALLDVQNYKEVFLKV